MGKVVAALLVAVFIGVNLYSAEAADINLDGNTSEPLWDDSISGVLSPAGGDISYIGYRYIMDKSQSRLYISFQYVDDSGAASSKVIVQLGGQSVTLAANNSASNSCARYKGVLLGSLDVMIEAEITLDMRSIDSAVVTVYDSSGHSSGAHRIALQKPQEPDPAPTPTPAPTTRPATTAPAQQDQGGNDQNPQLSDPKQEQGDEQGEIGVGTVDRDKEQVFSDDNTNGGPSMNGVTQNSDSSEDTAVTEDSEDITSGMLPKNYLFPKVITGIVISSCAMICGMVYKRRRDRKR